MIQFLSDRVFLAGGTEHPHAMRRLRSRFPQIDWCDGQGDGPTLTLRTDSARPEGSYRIVREGINLTLTGGPFSGVVFGTEDLIDRGGSHPGRLALPETDIDEVPGLTYRTFWTWDHSTNWELSQVGQQEIGVFNPYGKPPSGYLGDYKRCVDFCSENRISAIVIYGFLRDSHGGVEAGQELCRYANERGVRILPGIAIGSYGGIYWEGNSSWNLATWLKDNPQHAASLERGVGFQIADLAFPLNFPKSDYTLSAYPSAPETNRRPTTQLLSSRISLLPGSRGRRRSPGTISWPATQPPCWAGWTPRGSSCLSLRNWTPSRSWTRHGCRRCRPAPLSIDRSAMPGGAG